MPNWQSCVFLKNSNWRSDNIEDVHCDDMSFGRIDRPTWNVYSDDDDDFTCKPALDVQSLQFCTRPPSLENRCMYRLLGRSESQLNSNSIRYIPITPFTFHEI